MKDEELFGREFARRLEVLRAAARRLIREGRWQQLRESRPGPGQEFSDHRDYVPGDEIRHIDWHAYARLDRAKVRVFEENERPSLTILLDRSASMEGAAYREARRVAAGLAYVGLCHLGEVRVTPFSSARDPGVGPLRGPGSFQKILALLGPLRPEGTTRLAQPIRWSMVGRRGVAVILSDLLQDGEWESSIRRVRGHRLVLIHWEPEEPRPQGLTLLRDRETGEVLRRAVTDRSLARLQSLREAASRRIEEVCRGQGAAYLHPRAGAPFEEVVLEVLRKIA